MPWKPSDAKGKTKKANTKSEQKQWATVANKVLKSTGNDAKAVRAANAAIDNK